MTGDRSDGVRITGKPFQEEPRQEQPKCPVIPIVFLPGIMASNLRVKPSCVAEVKQAFVDEGRGQDFTDKAWEPPSVRYSILKTAKTVFQETLGANSQAVKQAKTWEQYGPGLRQVLLNPKTIEVDENGFLPGFVPGFTRMDGRPAMAAARDRGWGTVHWDCYGRMLVHLEQTLNPSWHFDPEGSATRAQRVEMSVAMGGGLPDLREIKPTDAEVAEAVKNRYPVHAVGYNWTQSNLQSAQEVLAKISTCIQAYQAAGHPCQRVILVTHSMGGLVARVTSQLDAAGLILGVVHGVMPATGAPVAYRRMVAGTEHGHLPIYKDLLGVFASIAGRTAEETTPVMGNAPGALELLPSHLYPPGWLKVERDKGDGEIELLFALPGSAGPYFEIYREKEAWWRLVDPELLDPAKILNKDEKTNNPEPAWINYYNSIEDVMKFHQSFLSAENYHQPSFFFYGKKKQTFASVRWRLPPDPNHLVTEEIRRARYLWGDGKGSREILVTRPDPMTGKVVDGKYHFGTDWRIQARLQGADGDGDGTVPAESGRAPEVSIPEATHLQGFEHADAYRNMQALYFTVMAICRLAGGRDPARDEA